MTDLDNILARCESECAGLGQRCVLLLHQSLKGRDALLSDLDSCVCCCTVGPQFRLRVSLGGLQVVRCGEL